MLTTAQQAAVKAYILADPVLAPLTSGPGTDYGAIAAAMSANAVPSYVVWRPSTTADDVMDAIAWASLTPADVPDGTAAYTNRALACQCRQINLQIMLQGKAAVPTGKLTFRQGLQDALLNVPAGAGGALVDAGWAGAGKVKATISRPATVVEKLFATGTGSAASPATLTYEGGMSIPDISAMFNA